MRAFHLDLPAPPQQDLHVLICYSAFERFLSGMLSATSSPLLFSFRLLPTYRDSVHLVSETHPNSFINSSPSAINDLGFSLSRFRWDVWPAYWEGDP